MEIIAISQKYNFAQFEFISKQANFASMLIFRTRDMMKSFFILNYSDYIGKNKNVLKHKYERFRRIAKKSNKKRRSNVSVFFLV